VDREVRAAVVGCGFQGQLHIDCLRAIEGVRVVGACDPDPGRLREASAAGAEAVFASFTDMLDSVEIDMLTICTMPYLHQQMVVDALGREINVLCEKPMALTYLEGVEMARAQDRSGALLGFGFNMRFMDSPLAVRDLVSRGVLGVPIYTRAWARSSHIPWWGRHFQKDLSGGGALASTAVHLLDLALWLANGPRPTTASASMARVFPRRRRGTAPSLESARAFDVEDLISGHVRCEGGFWLSIEGSWVDNRASTADQPSWDYSLDAFGSLAQAQLDPLLVSVEDPDGAVRSLDLPAGSMNFPQSVKRIVRDFVESVRSGTPPAVTVDQALEVQLCVDALYKSALLGREVDLDSLRV